MKNKNLFVSKEIAEKLEEKGFEESCFADYYVFGDNIAREGKYGQTEEELFIIGEYPSLEDKIEELSLHAYHCTRVPLYQQVISWLLEKHQLLIVITSTSQESWQWHIQFPHETLDARWEQDFTDYQEALEEGIKEALKLI